MNIKTIIHETLLEEKKKNDRKQKKISNKKCYI